MGSGKTLTNLAVCLAFWIALVLLFLTTARLDDKATATPIAAPDAREKVAVVVPAEPVVELPPVATTETVEPLPGISGTLRSGESFDSAMKRAGVAETVRTAVIRGFAKTLDFRTLQPGDRFTISLDKEESLLRAAYIAGPLHTHTLDRTHDGSFLAALEEVPLEYRVERLGGVITTSLYTAFAAIGEEPKLIHAYADIFASKIDFNTETRSGDSFELLVEKYYKEDKLIWSLFLAFRKLDRWLKTVLFRKRYEFILPGKIKR